MSSTAEASEASVVAYSDLMAQFMDASAGGQGETPDEGEQLVAVDESLQPADPAKLKAAMKAAAQAHRAWDAKGTDFDFILKKSEASESTSGTKHERELKALNTTGKDADKKLGDLMCTVKAKKEADVTVDDLKKIEGHMETLAATLKDGNSKVSLLKRWL